MNNTIKVGIGILLIGVLSLALLYFFVYTPGKLKNEVYSEFTCTCCENSLADSSCFMAGGMREYIDKFVEAGKGKESVMLEAVKKIGLSMVKDDEVKIEYGLKFVENVPMDTPQLVIKPEMVDIGILNNSQGVRIQDFKVKNNRTEDLIIYDLKTSCSCLTTSFIKDGIESVRTGRFSHSEGWNLIIKPGEEATLRAYYDPRVTNWQTGKVDRLITITSNDPLFYEKVVKISAELVD